MLDSSPTASVIDRSVSSFDGLVPHIGTIANWCSPGNHLPGRSVDPPPPTRLPRGVAVSSGGWCTRNDSRRDQRVSVAGDLHRAPAASRAAAPRRPWSTGSRRRHETARMSSRSPACAGGHSERSPCTPLAAGPKTRRATPRSASDLDFLGSPYGIRTRAATLRGWCPRPLDERAEQRSATLAAGSTDSHLGRDAPPVRTRVRFQRISRRSPGLATADGVEWVPW